MNRQPYLYLALVVALAAPALARPRTGNVVRPQDWKHNSRWPASVRVDPRAQFVIPVNVVRIYSNEHSARQIAPDAWLRAQLHLANQLYLLPAGDMQRYGNGQAPCIQFRIHKVYDVHENEVSETLGYKLDTEKVFGAGKQTHNGPRVSNTMDLRSLKVSEGANQLTVYCVWALKQPFHSTSEFGGESNIGFAEQMPSGPRRVLRRVTAKRAKMGVVIARYEKSWMNTLAHEFGHYFGLFHAWEKSRNQACGLNDLGDWSQGKVDPDPEWANVMDYDNGPRVRQYFSVSQLNYMFKFARDKVSTQVRVDKQAGGGVPPVVKKKLAVDFKGFSIAATKPGGPVTAVGDFHLSGAKGKKGTFCVWFNDRTGQKLRDTDKQYTTADGQVSMFVELNPGFDPAAYNKFKVMLPAGQLHLPPGRHTLQANAGVFIDGKFVGASKFAKFEYTVPGKTKKPAGRIAAWVSTTKVAAGVVAEGKRWVRINSDVVMDNLVGRDVVVEARFYLTDGRQLKDFDNQFRSPDGMVFTSQKIVPKFQRTTGHMVLWIPEAQLHLVAGRWPVYATLSVVHAGKTLTSSQLDVFTVGKGKAPAPVVASATFENAWVTHNHKVDNQLGLQVHCRFVVNGHKGKPLTAVVWFWNSRGERLKDFNGSYKTSDGQVSVSTTATPLYPSTRFGDLTIFIPYSELHLVRGVHDLGATIGVFSGGTTKIGSRDKMVLFRVTQR